MRSLGKGVMSATTQVKVLSPEIISVALGQGFHYLEASIGMYVNGECMFDMPGSESVAGKRTVYIGTWENRIVPNGSCRGVEKATKQYGVSVVGLTHSACWAVHSSGGLKSLWRSDEERYIQKRE
jgi:hypothetical protein